MTIITRVLNNKRISGYSYFMFSSFYSYKELQKICRENDDRLKLRDHIGEIAGSTRYFFIVHFLFDNVIYDIDVSKNTSPQDSPIVLHVYKREIVDANISLIEQPIKSIAKVIVPPDNVDQIYDCLTSMKDAEEFQNWLELL